MLILYVRFETKRESGHFTSPTRVQSTSTETCTRTMQARRCKHGELPNRRSNNSQEHMPCHARVANNYIFIYSEHMHTRQQLSPHGAHMLSGLIFDAFNQCLHPAERVTSEAPVSVNGQRSTNFALQAHQTAAWEVNEWCPGTTKQAATSGVYSDLLELQHNNVIMPT